MERGAGDRRREEERREDGKQGDERGRSGCRGHTRRAALSLEKATDGAGQESGLHEEEELEERGRGKRKEERGKRKGETRKGGRGNRKQDTGKESTSRAQLASAAAANSIEMTSGDSARTLISESTPARGAPARSVVLRVSQMPFSCAQIVTGVCVWFSFLGV
eukprot:2742095-Rhodomonas_salina.1